MAESIEQQKEVIQQAISSLEQAVPLIATPSRHGEGLQQVIAAAEQIGSLSFDEKFKSLATSMKILTNGESPILETVTYQAFILDILEMLTTMLDHMKNEVAPEHTEVDEMVAIGRYLIRVAGRVTNRFKIKIIFEQEYEAKALRAFMALKELSGVVRFLNVSPDVSSNQNANLENGLELDVLSQETAEELHRIAGSVLQVENVQIFSEMRPQRVLMLDPPSHPDSFDQKIQDFISN